MEDLGIALGLSDTNSKETNPCSNDSCLKYLWRGILFLVSDEDEVVALMYFRVFLKNETILQSFCEQENVRNNEPCMSRLLCGIYIL
mmetsp:Transcript_43835/g.105755  ORF Transcript_43835/g.105755 Transcript_43835/m.105755 type:complete len:87 (+) Transcript_43835:1870-2130(+)